MGRSTTRRGFTLISHPTHRFPRWSFPMRFPYVRQRAHARGSLLNGDFQFCSARDLGADVIPIVVCFSPHAFRGFQTTHEVVQLMTKEPNHATR